MDRESERLLFEQLRNGYRSLQTKKERQLFLNDALTKIFPAVGARVPHRKALLRRLNQVESMESSSPKKVGRKRRYGDVEGRHLRNLWVMNNFACGKRLKPALPDWLKFYECPAEVRGRLLTMSAATMDRMLTQAREIHRRESACSTVGQKAHIRRLIKLREPGQLADRAGYIETDTVVHCGDFAWGAYGNSVTATDLYSGWTEARMILGKNAEKVVGKLKAIEAKLPFELRALYFDNGIEYVNHLLFEEFSKSARGTEISVARGRAGKKNDQCHVEQKNNTYIRQILGYERIESQVIVDLVNDLYENEWSNLHNHFLCQLKLKAKDRIGNKTHRKYDTAKTPYQRLLESEHLPEADKEKLRKEHARLNPIQLHSQVQKKLAIIWNHIKNAEKASRTS